MSSRRGRRIGFTFDPRKRGLRRLLGDLESEVMEIVWKSAGPVTVRQVHQAISRQRELAYTTVMTVMGRLAEKGLLTRREGDGPALVYEPALSREDFLLGATKSILKALLTDFSAPTMTQLVELLGDQSDERIEELARRIEEKRRME